MSAEPIRGVESFDSLLVVGLGLIGGSIAAAARRLDPTPVIYGVDVDPDTLLFAVEHGLVDAAAQPDIALQSGWLSGDEVDLIVLATPVDRTVEWLAELARAGYRGVVTDVASTKSRVVDTAEKLEGAAFTFIGGHPMAGSERSGIDAARGDLFDGAYYMLTPGSAAGAKEFAALHAFVSSLGARVVSVEPAAHDDAVAIISHVPHVAAAALVELASQRAAEGGEDLLRLAAGGFKDMTRIAAGSPELWTGICMDNADAVASGLAGLREVIARFEQLVSTRDVSGIQQWLAGAADVRRAIPAQWVPATSRLSELSLPVSDRPGVISSVTTAVGRAGCNIEDIEIDHQSEDAAVLRLVLTDEGDVEGLMRGLQQRGFHPQLRPLEEGVER
ncbi:MAG: prephenate dehydrogenase/arogenate dehydrogenase family protein [Coriobacteriia bacterium]|nr:prephenate dehydrogenase/arogenate dehydrogenase family protein [Coriobacteriia bacterium]MBN2823102.1 prephenate dehydrogenase/arogenate dehydrogenase family protein [Coriobacteriia bacterium]